jgi:hypothetical protein
MRTVSAKPDTGIVARLARWAGMKSPPATPPWDDSVCRSTDAPAPARLRLPRFDASLPAIGVTALR